MDTTAPRTMKIAGLEKRSGVGRSTIHHYLNLGLLPAPYALGPKKHLFDEGHLARLEEIRKLRDGGWSLAKIRARLEGQRVVEPKRRPVDVAPADATHGHIVDRATQLFAERGYDGVRLSDVAKQAGVGKATLYRYFPNKEALFVDCVERVRFTLIPKDVSDANDQHESVEVQARNRAAAVLAHFSAFRTLSNLLGSVSHGRDPALAVKARTELHSMVTNAVPLFVRMMDARLVRQVDPELLAYMAWFALMGAGERMSLEPKLSETEVLDAYLELMSFGIRTL